MGLLRSEVMKYGMLVLPAQSPQKCIELLGRETNIQFEDMNSREMRRPFRRHVQRLEEMERILRVLFDEMARLGGCELVKNKVDEFLANSHQYKLDSVESELQRLYTQFVSFRENNAALVGERNAAVEEAQVVAAALAVLRGDGGAQNVEVADDADVGRPLLADDALTGRSLGTLSGVVPKVDELRFARALWRASRGNLFTQFEPIAEPLEDPKTGQAVEKSVFVVYFQGATGSMHQRVLKICLGFGVNMYSWPSSAPEADPRLLRLKQTIAEKNVALHAYQEFLRSEMATLIAPPQQSPENNSKIEEWRLFCLQEKAMYAVLNMCSGDIALHVNVWYPEEEEAKIRSVLGAANEGSQQGAFLTAVLGATPPPPTYFRVNDYTAGFQEIVETYGIARYREANPALLAIVTFPFIFGMMYGDVGHGAMLLAAGLCMCWYAESLRFSMPGLFMARYMVLSLGIFSTFAGFLYNDFFSVGLQLFASGFEDTNGDGHFTPKYDVTNSGGPGPYPFGLDWAWHGANNELLFVNSLKMKLSVLFGVLQMFVGILLRLSNSVRERNATDFLFEGIPMMIFLVCFFGWMDVMIVYKWVHPIDAPPSIINSLICMAMGSMGGKDEFPLWQGSVELAQLLMKWSICAIPFMLIPKPIIILIQHKIASRSSRNGEHERLLDVEADKHGAHGHGEEFAFDEIIIHQVIETIEYVLGTISHTASYLRIWALSLAHQQLALVFFQKTMGTALVASFPANIIVTFIMFCAWFGITLAVLLGMDVLECFLHTLRLHWIEFQSKFYKADGEKFMPFNVREIIGAQD